MTCNPNECEARCCYDGVYLHKNEVKSLRAVVKDNAEFFSFLPKVYFQKTHYPFHEAYRKVKAKLFKYKDPDFPLHFTKTRCVFCVDNLCSLQTLAVQKGLHKWTFKPVACWLYPILIRNAKLTMPPMDGDPINSFGMRQHTPCGKHKASEGPWEKQLKAEIAYYNKNKTQVVKCLI